MVITLNIFSLFLMEYFYEIHSPKNNQQQQEKNKSKMRTMILFWGKYGILCFLIISWRIFCLRKKWEYKKNILGRKESWVKQKPRVWTIRDFKHSDSIVKLSWWHGHGRTGKKLEFFSYFIFRFLSGFILFESRHILQIGWFQMHHIAKEKKATTKICTNRKKKLFS